MNAFFASIWAWSFGWLLNLVRRRRTSSVAPSSSSDQQKQQRTLEKKPKVFKQGSSSLSSSFRGKEIALIILTAVAKIGREKATQVHVFQELVSNDKEEEYAWFVSLANSNPNIVRLLILLTSTELRLPRGCDVALFVDLTAEELDIVASSFAASLRSRRMANSGTDHWIGKYKAIQNITEEHPFLKFSIVSIGQNILLEAPWGSAFRIWSGAIISFFDMITDIVMIFDYFENDLSWGAHFLLFCVSLNIVVQNIIVIAQNRKLGPARVAQEMVIIFLCVKPAADAARLVSGKAQEKGTPITPFQEMQISKLVEVVSEALPSSTYQVFVMLRSGRASRRSVVSILISLLSVALASTSVAFDFDCDSNHRANRPDFYVSGAIPNIFKILTRFNSNHISLFRFLLRAQGYIKDDSFSRNVTFISMFLFSFFHVTLKVLTFGLLMTMNNLALLCYLCGSMSLFMGAKFLRKDFTYWLNIRVSSLVLYLVVLVHNCSNLSHLTPPPFSTVLRTGSCGFVYFVYREILC
jgi:hypothetical protein